MAEETGSEGLPATVRIDGHRFSDAKVRKKGYIGSNDTKRPGLKIQLGRSRAGEPKALVTELTLNNNNQDSSLVRQYLAYEIFRRAGVPAPRCSFARVTVNGVPLGVFTHVEAIKRPFLKRSFGRDDGPLYEGSRSDLRSGWVQNFEIKSEGKLRPRADLEAATKAIEDAGQPLLAALNRYLDLEEFLRFWAVESLINHADGYSANCNNFYLYHNPVTEKLSFIPWGADTVMYPARRGGERESGPKSVIAVGILAYRLYSSSDGCELYRATLRQVLKKAWDEEALLKEADRLQTLLAPGAMIPVNNTHVFGGFMATNGKGQVTNMVGMLRGTLRLRTAGQEPDAKVEGDVSVDVFSKLPAP